MQYSLVLSLLTSLFIGGAAGYLGSLMLGRRMALVAGPLGHLTLPGIALGLVFGFNISLGAFPFVFLGVVLIWLFELRTKLPMEALTAVVFTFGVAIAFLFLPIAQAEAALIGDIAKVDLIDTLVTIVICTLLFAFIRTYYSKMVLINISEDLAKSEGISVKKFNFMYLFFISVIVALGVKMVGGLLTVALVAIPAASMRNLSNNLSQYAYGSMIIGASSSVIGIILFKMTGLPAGPLIILVGTIIFLISLIFKR